MRYLAILAILLAGCGKPKPEIGNAEDLMQHQPQHSGPYDNLYLESLDHKIEVRVPWDGTGTVPLTDAQKIDQPQHWDTKGTLIEFRYNGGNSVCFMTVKGDPKLGKGHTWKECATLLMQSQLAAEKK